MGSSISLIVTAFAIITVAVSFWAKGFIRNHGGNAHPFHRHWQDFGELSQIARGDHPLKIQKQALCFYRALQVSYGLFLLAFLIGAFRLLSR